jgi:anti-sigma regulatory factor (Ser/Thr protein kinase)
MPTAHLLYREAHGLRAGGFGILFARKLVDEVTYNEHGNEVILVKYLTA